MPLNLRTASMHVITVDDLFVIFVRERRIKTNWFKRVCVCAHLAPVTVWPSKRKDVIGLKL